MAKVDDEKFEDEREIELEIHRAMEKAIVAFNEVMSEWDIFLGLKFKVKWFYDTGAVMKKYSIEERWESLSSKSQGGAENESCDR